MLKHWIYYVLALCILVAACKKDESPDNPFDGLPEPPEEDSLVVDLDPNSIAGIHYNIFKPTCANSGCHDGTFEPDFRTIESSYNTLVYQPIIKNDPAGTFDYRVVPGNPSQSVLVARLNYDIDGFSGIMPLVGSDAWEAKKTEYIQNITNWVQSGAKDVFGNGQTIQDGVPYMEGVAAKTSDWLERGTGGLGAILVPNGTTSLDLFFALKDDNTATNNFTNNKIRFADLPNDFESATELSLQIQGSPTVYTAYLGGNADYYHKININPMDYGSLGTTVYFRVYVKDAANPITELPSDNGAYYIKDYFSFTIVE